MKFFSGLRTAAIVCALSLFATTPALEAQTIGTVVSTLNPTAITPIAGALADYTFTQGSGTSLLDISGNANNGTLGTSTLAPTWVTNGLSFAVPQQVSLPAALNATRTFYLAVYMNPVSSTPGSGLTGNDKPVLVSSSLDLGGTNISYGLFGAGNGSDTYALMDIASFSFRTYTSYLFSGFHVICVTLGTGGGDLDHFYVDGKEVSSYRQQLASAGAQTSGNLFLGSSNSSQLTNSGFLGTYYRAVFLSGEDSAATVATRSKAILTDVTNRGVLVTPTPNPQVAPLLMAIGDSITYGLGLTGPFPSSQAWPNNLSLTNQPAYTVVDMGIPGITVLATFGSESSRPFIQECKTAFGPSVALLLLGTNDVFSNVYNGTSMAAAVSGTFGSLMAEAQMLKKAGCTVFVGTILDLSATGTAGGGGTPEQWRDAYDAQVLSQAVRLGADGVIDFAANPLLGADGACTNTTYFQGDCVHPTSTGHTLMAAAASNALNYYFGSTVLNPTVVTAASHTILAGEGYVTSNPTANQTLTLPDCTGQSGATYTVANIQSAFTVGVVNGSSSQLINGLTTGTVVSVPSNSSVVFHDVANPKSVSGCHWEK